MGGDREGEGNSREGVGIEGEGRGAKGGEPPPSCPHTPAEAQDPPAFRPSVPPAGPSPSSQAPGHSPHPTFPGPLSFRKSQRPFRHFGPGLTPLPRPGPRLTQLRKGAGDTGALCEVTSAISQGSLCPTWGQGHQELCPPSGHGRGAGTEGGSQPPVSRAASLPPQPHPCPFWEPRPPQAWRPF